MNKTLLDGFIKILICLLATTFIIPSTVAETEQAYAADRAALLLIKDDIVKAINAKEFEKILPHLTETPVVTFHDSVVANSKQEIIDYYERLFNGENAILSNVTTQGEVDAPASFYLNGNFATAFGHTNDVLAFKKGRDLHMRSAWSTSVVKQNGTWKIAAIHFSSNLFDNPVLSFASALKWFFALGGLLLGFLLAWFFIGKRNKAS